MVRLAVGHGDKVIYVSVVLRVVVEWGVVTLIAEWGASFLAEVSAVASC